MLTVHLARRVRDAKIPGVLCNERDAQPLDRYCTRSTTELAWTAVELPDCEAGRRPGPARRGASQSVGRSGGRWALPEERQTRRDPRRSAPATPPTAELGSGAPRVGPPAGRSDRGTRRLGRGRRGDRGANGTSAATPGHTLNATPGANIDMVQGGPDRALSGPDTRTPARPGRSRGGPFRKGSATRCLCPAPKGGSPGCRAVGLLGGSGALPKPTGGGEPRGLSLLRSPPSDRPGRRARGRRSARLSNRLPRGESVARLCLGCLRWLWCLMPDA